MNLGIITAVIAVCGAAKLDRTYLPPLSAKTAGGSPGSLQTPLTKSSDEGLETPVLPTGSYTNNFQGVVVDAAASGTRASAEAEPSGLGGLRPSYGSTDSKVGDAAFRGSVAGFRGTPTFEAPTLDGSGQIVGHSGFPLNGQGNSASNFQGFLSKEASIDENRSERPQATKDRNSNILNFNNDVSSDNYSYGFETDNGIAVGENGVAVNGIQAEGGYSYHGDDGQVYKITYTADEGGYRPQGDHLPTPPPIPHEILKSLEKNAKEEAAGHVDDGSYDAQKYNTDGDYTRDTIAIGGNNQYNGAQLPQFGKRPESDATASGTINQNSQAFGKPGNSGSGNYNTYSSINGQTSHGNFGSAQYGLGTEQNSHAAFNGQSQGNGVTGSANFGTGVTSQSSHSAFNSQSQGNGVTGSADFGKGVNSQSSHSDFNGQSQGNPVSGSAHFETGANVHSSHSAFNGQSQGNGVYGSGNFGTGANAQSSDSVFNGLSQGSGDSGSIAQNSPSAFNGQSIQGIQHHSNSQNDNDYSQNTQISQSSQQNGPDATGFNSGNALSHGSQFNQQGPTSGLSGNGSPLGSQHNKQVMNSQFGSKPSKPAFGQNSGNFGSNAGTTQTQFGSQFTNGQGQVSHGFSGVSNYPNNQGTPSKYNKQGQTQFSSSAYNTQSSSTGNYKQPISGQSQVTQFGSTTNNNNRFPQTQFGNKNEYLPPLNSLSSGSNSNFGSSGSSISEFSLNSAQKPIKNEQVPNSIAFNGQTSGASSASASASFGQPAFKPQSAQFNYNFQQAPQTVPGDGSKPTAVPDTELTTPLEPSETQSASNSQFFGGSTNPGSLGSKPFNQQTQTQLGFDNSASQESSPTLSSSFPTSSPHISSNSPFGSTSIQSVLPASSGIKPESSNKPQFSQNSFSIKPSYNQVTDRPYQYNQPSKPFSATIRPQGSRFPSSSSNYPNGVASQNQFIQQNSFQNSNQLSGSLAPVSPTSATHFSHTQGSSNYNGITQASVSPFPSPAPTASQFSQNGQFGSKPTFNQQSTISSQFLSSNQQNKPSFPQQPTGQQSFPSRPVTQFGQKPIQPHTQQFGQNVPTSGLPSGSSHEQASGTQQYEGSIYQYNKPVESQTAQSGQKPTHFGQSETKPVSSEGSSQQQSTVNQQYQGTVYQYNKPAEIPTSQSGQKPAQFGQNEAKPELSGSSQQQTTVAQQYEGTIYQYNKPVEVLPAPTPDSSSSQTIQTGVTSGSKPVFGQSQGNQLPTQQNIKPQFGSQAQIPGQNSFSSQSQQTGPTQGSFGAQANKPFGNSQSSTQFGQVKPVGYGSSQSHQTTEIQQFGAQPTSQPQLGAQVSSSSTQLNQQETQPTAFKPFGAAYQGVQSVQPFSKPQFGSQVQPTQPFGASQTVQPERGSGTQSQSSSQNFGNAASSQDNGYFYPKNPQPQFLESSQIQFGQSSASSMRPGTTQFSQNAPSPGPQSSESSDHQQLQTQFNSKPQFGTQSQTQFGQNAQTPTSNTPFGQPQIGQVSSQAIASGQASASAFASNTPQTYKPFGQSDSQGSQALKPFDSNGQETSNSKPYGALNLSPFGVNESADVSNPLFGPDSASSQSTVRPSVAGVQDQTSFQGAQNLNAQGFVGKGEMFGGPRQPPKFDDNTGYHY